MGKLKTLFSNMSNSIKETYKKFPITIIIAYIITLIYAFGSHDFIRTFEKEDWLFVMIIWAIGAFFSETFFSKRKMKILGGIISLGIATGFRILLQSELQFEEVLQRILMTYTIVLPLLTLYEIIKKSKLKVHEYGLNVLSNFGKCTAIYILANLGIVLVLLIFIELILDGNDFDILGKTLILLLGGYYIPALINAITDMTQETGKFIKVLVMYVFTPIVIVLLGILYLYVIKITINGELLHNEIFFILSLTFSVTIPVALLQKNYANSDKLNKFTNMLVCLFIPFIILQIIAIGIRVNDYGLTETRYFAYLLIIFEIVFITLIFVNKSKYLDKSIIFATLLIIFATLSPLNFQKVPIISQTARINKMLSNAGSFENLTNDEKNECKRAYIFLTRNSNQEYMKKKIDEETLEKIENYVSEYNNEDEIATECSYIYVNNVLDGLDISEYSKIYEIYKYYSSEEINYSNYVVSNENNQVNVTIDLQEFMNKMIDADKKDNTDAAFEKYRLLETDNENIKVYLTNFSMSYEIYTKKTSYIEVSGYILVK